MSHEQLSKFNIAVGQAQRKWERENRNFGSAYARAFHNYNTLLKQQQDEEKAAAERKAQLVMLALSLAGGSVLGAVFAKTAAKSVAGELAKNAALNFVVNKNLEKTFSALVWVEGSVTAKFVMGKVWDEASKKMTKQLETQVKEAAKEAKVPTGTVGAKPVPLEYQNNLMNVTSSLASAVTASGLWMYEQNGGAAALQGMMNSSPFLTCKEVKLDVSLASARIELAFWMKFVLDQDYLTSGNMGYSHKEGMYYKGSGRVSAISQSPSGGDYPTGHRSSSTYSDVGYKSVGGIISKRINELYLQTGAGSGQFISEDDGIFSGNNVSRGLLKNAEACLLTLGDMNKDKIKKMQVI